MTISRALFLLLLFLSAAFAQAVGRESKQSPQSAGDDFASRLGLYEGERGTSCADFLGDILPWQRRGGDWLDASGILYGKNPYAVSGVGAAGAAWDVSKLVRKIAEAGRAKAIFYLRPVSGTGYARFNSREAKSIVDRPMLVLEFAGDRRQILEPKADTHLDCSTYKALGRSETLSVSSQQSVLLEFALPDSVRSPDFIRARLVLSSAGSGGGKLEVGVFETAIPELPHGSPQQGLAANYPADRGIDRHPDVVFSTGFDEGSGWRSRWSRESSGSEAEVIATDPGLRFDQLAGAAFRVNLKKGSNYGTDLRLYLKDHGGEPDELYFRYYVRFAEDWNPDVSGGKMPGLGGTYGKAGWGGRRVDGTDGWSMRGAFLQAFPNDHPMHGLTQLGTYAYHMDQKDFWGDVWIWPGALLARNRWYCIEQYVRLNRPGAADGVIRVWMDGRLAMERSDIRYRSVERLHVEDAWLNVYHGGAAVSPHNQHLYIDNVVIAKSYIGPLPTR